ncbi:ABC-type transport system involved in multi-copper enzyme maturation permease subunit [Actinoplanes octamycinicus]|uniref:ABC-type transport system involved in multi-copper enzyme maturation permease subunit n=1 Tax=Actinoplanes octamycinicus TaxID=135948 RepID=A0A7W7H1I5_9ACTN|nr:ABC transporter permease subunit [Actinoplanes octamycinicus]MBB4742094.1 ABC-type transport system involved in multi-copper enzyme maturation permease subunit [Actinoplanes octamycinicus]GIE60060.1 ABC transporter permease [Actinoplanes octamycinicus]
MTTPTAHAAVPADASVTVSRVIRAEWIKFRSLRSSLIMMAATIAVFAALGLGFSAFLADATIEPGTPAPPGGPSSLDPLGASLGGVNLAQLLIATLGVLLIAGEYSTGMIRSSLAAVPRRWPVLAGKVAVLAGVSLATLVPTVLLTFVGAQTVLGDKGIALTDSGVLRAVLGTAGYLAGVGVLGMAFGFLLRNTAAALTSVVAVLLILPGVVSLLPESWSDTIAPYLPSNAGQAFMSIASDPGLLSPGAGAAVFTGWLVLLLAAAVTVLRRRDA